MDDYIKFFSYFLSVAVVVFLLFRFLSIFLAELQKPVVPTSNGQAEDAKQVRSVMAGALLEKEPGSSVGSSSGAQTMGSFSRVAGAIGAFGLAVIFIGIGLWLLYALHFTQTNDVILIIAAVGGKYILAGAAMFFPYGVNQIASIFHDRTPSAAERK